MLCEQFTDEQINLRDINKIYVDNYGNDEFELVISAYYQIDFEDEYKEEVELNGKIELINGEKIEFEELKRNGCDCLQLLGINKDGKRIEILSEELA